MSVVARFVSTKQVTHTTPAGEGDMPRRAGLVAGAPPSGPLYTDEILTIPSVYGWNVYGWKLLYGWDNYYTDGKVSIPSVELTPRLNHCIWVDNVLAMDDRKTTAAWLWWYDLSSQVPESY